jgi:hypothetical protein
MLEDLQIRNYSPSTVAAYIRRVAEFAKHFGTSPEWVRPEEIRECQLYLIKSKTVSLSAYVQTVCGLRFLYSKRCTAPSASIASLAPVREEAPSDFEPRGSSTPAIECSSLWETAVEVLRESFDSDKERLRRFDQEARVMTSMAASVPDQLRGRLVDGHRYTARAAMI